MTWLVPTHVTETLEQTLGNATIAAEKSTEVAYIASNTAGFLTTLNTGTKALSVGYGLALTGASAVAAIIARNIYSRCLFGVGCGFDIVGTVSSTLTVFNVSLTLAPLALVSSATGTAWFWVGRKVNVVNALARVSDIPAI